MVVMLYTSRGEPFTVDDEDAPMVDRFSWGMYLCSLTGKPVPSPATYVRPLAKKKEGMLALRSLILGTPPTPEMKAFTINGDPLCMEKRNLAWLDAPTLRHWTNASNSSNGYRGIIPTPSPKRWRAFMGGLGLGTFPTKEEAARAYDQAALEHYGPWARLNFPDPDAPMPPGTASLVPETPLRASNGRRLEVDPELLPILSRHRWSSGPQGYWTRIGTYQLPLAYLVLGKRGSGSGSATFCWIDGDIHNYMEANLGWNKGGSIPFRGIARCVNKQGDRWIAKIYIQGRARYLGRFDTPEEAARVYDQAALDVFGPKTRLNFPQSRRLLTVECLPGGDSDLGLEDARAYDQAAKQLLGPRTRLNFPEDNAKVGGTMVNGGGHMRPDDSVIQSEVIGRKGNLTTVRVYLGRSAVSPIGELTLEAKLFPSIQHKSWLLVEDAVTRTRYRVKVQSITVKARRLPVYRAQEIR